MNMFLIFALVAVASAQFSTETPRWTGPIADHVNGQIVQDTPEVALAKAQHNNAHNEALAVLPILPPEERYIPGPRPGVSQSIFPSSQPIFPSPQPIFPSPQPIFPVQQTSFFPSPAPVLSFGQANLNNVQRFGQPAFFSQQPKVLAEEIPRSPLGETPEVAAARAAHLAAFQQVRNSVQRNF